MQTVHVQDLHFFILGREAECYKADRTLADIEKHAKTDLELRSANQSRPTSNPGPTRHPLTRQNTVLLSNLPGHHHCLEMVSMKANDQNGRHHLPGPPLPFRTAVSCR
jgi:hypothetical protein